MKPSSMVDVINKTQSRINLSVVRRTARDFLKLRKIAGAELSIAFVAPRTMARLNKTYRGKSGTTDVLSFMGEGDFLGEILIDYAQVKKQAREQDKTATDELIFILIHGLLHLSGYDDDTDSARDKMISLGHSIINKINKRKETER